MGTPSRSQLVATVAVGVVIVVFGALWARGGGAPDAGAGAQADVRAPATVAVDDDAAGGPAIVVHVAGAVRHPGVYRMPDGTRVAGAIRRAGGATRKADLDALNLAAKLADGRQVLVPSRAPRASGGAAAAPAPGDGVPVNINSATVDELDALDGVGPATAQKIVDYREEHGGFASVEPCERPMQRSSSWLCSAYRRQPLTQRP